MQGVLNYSALGAALTGLPTGIMLTLLSTRVGTIAGRIGGRRFLVIGPALMACALLWYARVPVTSEAWRPGVGGSTGLADLIPPVSTLIDILPAVLLFGLGISLVVAPLTTTLMGSVPVRNSGLASAINNAISRVGQPLLAAIIFIVISGSFYATLATKVPGLDPDSPAIRHDVQPLNPPAADVSPEIAAASKIASTDAFHLAALVGAGLLIAGSVVNGVGLSGRRPETSAEATPAEVA